MFVYFWVVCCLLVSSRNTIAVFLFRIMSCLLSEVVLVPLISLFVGSLIETACVQACQRHAYTLCTLHVSRILQALLSPCACTESSPVKLLSLI